MIQLRGVSKTVMSGGQPLTILHPLDLDVADGIHPNPRGAEIVADLVWKELEPTLRRPN